MKVENLWKMSFPASLDSLYRGTRLGNLRGHGHSWGRRQHGWKLPPPPLPQRLHPSLALLRAVPATDAGGASLASRKSSMVTVSVLESPL